MAFLSLVIDDHPKFRGALAGVVQILYPGATIAHDAIIIFERDAAGVVRIAYTNRAYVAVTGMTSESIVGHDIDEIRPRSDDARGAAGGAAGALAIGIGRRLLAAVDGATRSRESARRSTPPCSGATNPRVPP